jgi:hypothetical protein
VTYASGAVWADGTHNQGTWEQADGREAVPRTTLPIFFEQDINGSILPRCAYAKTVNTAHARLTLKPIVGDTTFLATTASRSDCWKNAGRGSTPHEVRIPPFSYDSPADIPRLL